MSREFDLLVPPLSRSVLTSDQAGAVEAAEITVDEGVSRFRLIRGSFRETEMPLAYSSQECDFKNAFSSRAFGWTSPHSLLRTYWRPWIKRFARAIARSFTE